VIKIQIPPGQTSNRDFSVRFSGSHGTAAEELSLGISSIHAIPSEKFYQTEGQLSFFSQTHPTPSGDNHICSSMRKHSTFHLVTNSHAAGIIYQTIICIINI
jgi:hypothetical protein